MTNILVDSSVWIDFFNNYQSHESDILQYMIENNDIYNIFICSTIYMEVLRGIRDDKVFSNIKETLLNFGILDIDMMTVTNMAIDIYRSLRKKGITIRKQNDCLIASYAILNDIPVFHKDRDFELIEKETKMNTYKKQ